MTDKMIKQNCMKLGIKDPIIAKKAEEFFRMLQNKTALKSINDGAKIIMCIDLAAATLGSGIDLQDLLTLSGLRKSAYQNNLHSIEKILNIDRPKTISELCVRLQCTEISESAEKLLASYREHDNKIKDLSHPQYAAVAVLVAAGLRGVKMDKGKLLELSHLKRKEWGTLVSEFEKFAQTMGFNKAEKKKGRILKENNEEKSEEPVNTTKKMKIEEEPEFEEYEVWKERILKEAESELLKTT